MVLKKIILALMLAVVTFGVIISNKANASTISTTEKYTYYMNDSVKTKEVDYSNGSNKVKTDITFYDSNSKVSCSETLSYYPNSVVKTKSVNFFKNGKKIESEVSSYNTKGTITQDQVITYANNKVLNKYYYKYLNNKKVINKVIFYYNTTSKKKTPLGKAYQTNYYNKNGKLSKVVYNAIEAERDAIVNFAKKQNGKSYSAGSTGPYSFDCSGLTSYVYKKAINKNIGRTTYDQVAKAKINVSVSTKTLKKGDLLFWGSKSAPYHVGIYLGNGNYMHASTPATGVKIEKLNGYYKPAYAKRVI